LLAVVAVTSSHAAVLVRAGADHRCQPLAIHAGCPAARRPPG
jgi:hypothetical protein